MLAKSINQLKCGLGEKKGEKKFSLSCLIKETQIYYANVCINLRRIQTMCK